MFFLSQNILFYLLKRQTQGSNPDLGKKILIRQNYKGFQTVWRIRNKLIRIRIPPFILIQIQNQTAQEALLYINLWKIRPVFRIYFSDQKIKISFKFHD